MEPEGQSKKIYAMQNDLYAREDETSRMKQKIYFVTGKGGVGKSTVAAALAYKLALQGKKTILVELGKQSFYCDLFQLKSPVEFIPQTLKKFGFDLALLSPDDCLKEYALHLLKLESLYKIFFQNPISKSLIEVAPGLKELAILGKITSKIRKHGPPLDYECIVVDAYATGHFLSLVQAPGAMAEAIPYGPMGEQSRSINQVLQDAEVCNFFIVSLPEELPMKESFELRDKLKSKLGVDSRLVLNKSMQARLKNVKENELREELKTSENNKNYIEQVIKFLGIEKEIQQKLSLEAAKPFDSLLPVTFESKIEKKLSFLAEHLNV